MCRVVDDEVERASVGAAQRRCHRPATVDLDAVGDLAAGENAQELAGVIAADPDPSHRVDAQAIGMPLRAEVGEHGSSAEGAVGSGSEGQQA